MNKPEQLTAETSQPIQQQPAIIEDFTLQQPTLSQHTMKLRSHTTPAVTLPH